MKTHTERRRAGWRIISSIAKGVGKGSSATVVSGDTVRSLIWEVAYSISVPAAKKRFFFFAPHVPFQRYLGCYQEAFEVGVVLGHAFRNRLTTFAKLFTEPGREQDVITFMQELAQRRLTEGGGAKDFFDLAIFAEERRMKPYWQESGCKEFQINFLEKHYKVPLKTASGNLHVAVSTGIGFGSLFSELTEQMWKARQERPIDRDEWAKWREAGYGDEPPEPVPLAKRQEELLSRIELFVSKACPGLLPQFKTQS